jgi:hypothetical protein
MRIADFAAGIADRIPFRMGGRIVVAHDAVAGGGEDLAVEYHHGAERAACLVDHAGLAHQLERRGHVRTIIIAGGVGSGTVHRGLGVCSEQT